MIYELQQLKEPFARIGRNAVVHPHVVIYEGAEIGDDFLAHSHAAVREFCRIGNRVTLQNGVDSPDEAAAIVGREAVLGGAAYIATEIVGPGVIRQTGNYQRIAFGEVFAPAPRISDRVARLVGSREIEISRIETGRARPCRDMKRRIAEALGRPSFEIFDC